MAELDDGAPEARTRDGRILVVDDDPAIVEIVQVFLESEGYGVVTAHDGQQALVCLSEQAFDVIVSDVDMPRLDSTTLLREARLAGSVARWLLITGNPADGRLCDLDVPVLKKPFSLVTLACMLEDLLSR
jgi:CheY-like chemotaxis protein